MKEPTDGNGTRLPDPTNAVPGSPEKCAVFEYRYANGFALHHPDDRRAHTATRDEELASRAVIDDECDGD